MAKAYGVTIQSLSSLRGLVLQNGNCGRISLLVPVEGADSEIMDVGTVVCERGLMGKDRTIDLAERWHFIKISKKDIEAKVGTLNNKEELLLVVHAFPLWEGRGDYRLSNVTPVYFDRTIQPLESEHPEQSPVSQLSQELSKHLGALEQLLLTQRYRRDQDATAGIP